MAVIGDRGAEVAVVVEGDERADDLRIGDALAHGRDDTRWDRPPPS
jgi:hypothetical protein